MVDVELALTALYTVRNFEPVDPNLRVVFLSNGHEINLGGS